MNVIIVGTGAVAAEITSYLKSENSNQFADIKYNLIGYIEFEYNIEKYWAKYKLNNPVIGDIYSCKINSDDHFIIAISDITFRKQVIEVLTNRGADIIGYTHYTSIVAESATLGIGNIIYPYCIIGPGTIIGNHNLITSYSFISHDCQVGNNNFFSTAGLSGRIIIGNDNFFGIRSTVIPHVKIGSNNVIQAGMVIDKDIENDATVFYKYKEKIIAIKQ